LRAVHITQEEIAELDRIDSGKQKTPLGKVRSSWAAREEDETDKELTFEYAHHFRVLGYRMRAGKKRMAIVMPISRRGMWTKAPSNQ
jgi:hypothetical protein